MQVKKFEAPTIQEALDVIKRELGPEAIILQTKKNKKGFGLMSRDSVEVTAAISDRSLTKKKTVENRLPEPNREAARKLPAHRQADLYDKVMDKHLAQASVTQDRVDLKGRGAGKKITATRYVEIDREEAAPEAQVAPQAASGSSGPAAGATAAGQARHAAARAALGSRGLEGAAGLGMTPKMTVEDEVKHLKRMVEELKSAQDDGARGAAGASEMLSRSKLANPSYQEAFEQLVMNGVDRRLAFNLIKKAAFELGDLERDPQAGPEQVLDQVAGEIMESTEVHSALSGIEAGSGRTVVLALVGPTGVGKTTTVAKLASEAILRRNLKVGLINLDSYKVAAFDQLGTYAKILNVPFRSVANADDLKVAIQDFHSLDLVIVDTTGRSQRDPESLREMQTMLQAVAGGKAEVRSQLVLSATTRDAELYDIAARFSIFRPQGLIVSKLDEATIFGSIFNVSQKAKLPLLYFTTGQRVPEDIEEATRERVAALILDF